MSNKYYFCTFATDQQDIEIWQLLEKQKRIKR